MAISAINPAQRGIKNKIASKARVGIAILMSSLGSACKHDSFTPINQASVNISSIELKTLDSLRQSMDSSLRDTKLYKFAADTLRLGDCSYSITEENVNWVNGVCKGRLANPRGFKNDLIAHAFIPEKTVRVAGEDSSYVTNTNDIRMVKLPIINQYDIEAKVIDPASVKVKINPNFFKLGSDEATYIPVEYYGKPTFDKIPDIDLKSHYYKSVNLEDAQISASFLNMLKAVKKINSANADVAGYYKFNTDLVGIPQYVLSKPGLLEEHIEQAMSHVPQKIISTGKVTIFTDLMHREDIKIKVLDGIYMDKNGNYAIPVEGYAKPKIYPKVVL